MAQILPIRKLMIKPSLFDLSFYTSTVMLTRFKTNFVKVTSFVFAVVFSNNVLANIQTIEVVKNNSKTLTVPEKIKTMIIGNPAIAKVVVLNPDTLLINATTFGNTSLSLIGKSGNNYEYKIQVTHDLGILRDHLKKIDSRITASSDPNGDAIILGGVASNQSQIYKAEEAALRYFGTFQSSLQQGNNAIAGGQGGRGGQGGGNRGGGPAADPTSRFDNDTVSRTTISSSIKIVNLIITNDSLQSEAERLQKLLKAVDERISVENVNNVLMLKGKVKTGAALSRALSIADRFIVDGGEPDFMVVSDQGGVLAGNTDERQIINPVIPRLTVGGGQGQGGQGQGQGGQGGGIGGGGQGGQGGFGGGGQGGQGQGDQGQGGQGQGGGVRNGNAGGNLFYPPKGNLAQNVARGDVIMVAQGRVMSTIRVDTTPRVEVQLRIVGVDRSKTEDLGIDWRLISTSTSSGRSTGVSIGSLLGDVTSELPGITGSPSGAINPGSSTLVLGALQTTASRVLSLSTFLRWVETRGAAKTLTEPLLTALSGESATFSVGGTLPVLTQDQTNTGGLVNTNITSQTITFLQYGLGIIVRPTVLENGKISIILDQTISEPDFNVAVPVLEADVPGFRTRTVNTITETADGETWAVAGLLNEDDTVDTRAVPILSKIPVLGWLFRNENKTKTRRELLLVVTARVVGDGELQASQMSKQENAGLVINPEAKPESPMQQAPLVPKPTAPKPIAPNSSAQSVLQKQQSYAIPTQSNKSTELIP